ncbi:SCO6745 family protein [Krasilnikovia sp. MM14-A1259]|uniref:SCO6745 family protein n=1 Tax=Krasilnikovia sp. MM14-A1259 TaxID=3373539 RepID=UPI00380A7341
MTPEQAAATAKPGLAGLVGAFAESPRTLRRARLLGLSGWAYHVSARAGALGDVKPETAAAAIGFIAPEAVTDGWEAAAKTTEPREVATWHLHELCVWGAEEIGEFPRLSRLLGLARRVVDGVDAAGLPLFAAWRAMPVPDTSPGAQAAVALHLLHEHRMSVQVLAVRASGLTPLQAIIAGPEGETGAVAFGWQPPYPPAGPIVRRLMWAESVADALAGQAYAELDLTERVELIGLLESLHHALGR